MNLPLILLRRVLLAALLVGAITMVALRHNAIATLRAEYAAQAGLSRESERLVSENQDIPRLRQEMQEVEKLRRENEELPKLRNEVRQLRRQTEDLEKLRAENERLMAQRNASEGQAGVAQMPADFTPKAALSDAGLSTPEATVQTFFWAASQGNLERVALCMGRSPDEFQGAVPERERKDVINQMEHFPGYRVAEKKVVAEDEVIIGVQTSIGGTILPMHLKRDGTEWKLEN